MLLKDISKIHRMDAADFNTSFYSRPGIRAQLISKNKRELINDFVLRPQNVSDADWTESALGKSFDMIHALNISSPGWTSSFPFTNKIVA